MRGNFRGKPPRRAPKGAPPRHPRAEAAAVRSGTERVQHIRCAELGSEPHAVEQDHIRAAPFARPTPRCHWTRWRHPGRRRCAPRRSRWPETRTTARRRSLRRHCSQPAQWRAGRRAPCFGLTVEHPVNLDRGDIVGELPLGLSRWLSSGAHCYRELAREGGLDLGQAPQLCLGVSPSILRALMQRGEEAAAAWDGRRRRVDMGLGSGGCASAWCFWASTMSTGRRCIARER